MRKNLDKIIFFLAAAGLILGLAFGAGMYSAISRNFIYKAAIKVKDNIVLVFQERENLMADGTPVHFLQPARQEGGGVTINEVGDDGALIFISGFFDGNNEMRLLQRDGTIVAKWPVVYSDHFPDTSFLVNPPETDRNIDTHGALIHPDGSVVFNYDYGGTVKLSRCGDIDWTVEHPTHHSLEVAEDGGYWVPGRHFIFAPDFERLPPMTRPVESGFYLEDLIVKLSADGQIVSQRSVPEILYENGLEGVLTSTGYSFSDTGYVDRELVHVNKIEELPSAFADQFPAFEAGDLMVSMRTYNMLFVVDPDSWQVKWYQVGPWLRQHDPEFHADGTFTVFNNNAYQTNRGPNDRTNLDAPRISNIMKMNPTTGQIDVVLGEREGEEFYTVVRGKHEVTENGGYLITEFEAGRVFESDANRRIIWEYINRHDEDEVLEVTEARILPQGYFTVQDWTCQ